MCVRDVDVQCVLQFTLINAAGCALHRRTSQVIHRLESYLCPQTDFWLLSQGQRRQTTARNKRESVPHNHLPQLQGNALH